MMGDCFAMSEVELRRVSHLGRVYCFVLVDMKYLATAVEVFK